MPSNTPMPADARAASGRAGGAVGWVVALYLAAIVAANVVTAHFGPAASVPVAFALIGATLTSRDRLHDAYGPRVMLWLIPAGVLLSLVLGAGRIAIASAAAFAVAESVDTLVYHGLRRQRWAVRSNGSNVAAAVVDSLVFPTLAFGAVLWPIILGQLAAKTLGGAAWSWVLARRRAVVGVAAAALLLCAAPRAEAQMQQPPRFVLQAQAGTAHYPWNNYEPTPNAGINALLFLPHGFSVLAVVSRDMTRGAQWIGIVALQFTLFSL